MPRTVRAPRGSELNCKGWVQEAAYRMLLNNLDPEVAERPEDLVVYGGSGRAARNWPAFEAIVDAHRRGAEGGREDRPYPVQAHNDVGPVRQRRHARPQGG